MRFGVANVDVLRANVQLALAHHERGPACTARGQDVSGRVVKQHVAQLCAHFKPPRMLVERKVRQIAVHIKAPVHGLAFLDAGLQVAQHIGPQCFGQVAVDAVGLGTVNGGFEPQVAGVRRVGLVFAPQHGGLCLHIGIAGAQVGDFDAHALLGRPLQAPLQVVKLHTRLVKPLPGVEAGLCESNQGVAALVPAPVNVELFDAPLGRDLLQLCLPRGWQRHVFGQLRQRQRVKVVALKTHAL